jgi:hypothetical protein
MFLKKLFFASASILMLALAYHLGASTATAQAPSNPVVGISNNNVVTANGDVYTGTGTGSVELWTLVSNVFSGPPVPTRQTSWGALKVKGR